MQKYLISRMEVGAWEDPSFTAVRIELAGDMLRMAPQDAVGALEGGNAGLVHTAGQERVRRGTGGSAVMADCSWTGIPFPEAVYRNQKESKPLF